MVKRLLGNWIFWASATVLLLIAATFVAFLFPGGALIFLPLLAPYVLAVVWLGGILLCGVTDMLAAGRDWETDWPDNYHPYWNPDLALLRKGRN